MRPRSLLLHVLLLVNLSLLAAGGVGFLLWLALGRPTLAAPRTAPSASPTRGGAAATTPSLTAGERLESLKVILTLVGGVGAVVALTVAYRRQRDGEIAEYREDTRLLTDRFGKAADQLGSDQAPVRVAGVYAMAELADDWDDGRQMCIDVLCAYLRMPYDPAKHQTGDKEVRRTTLRVIRNHLRPGWSETSWSTYRFSFEGAVFDCGDLSRAHFREPGNVTFYNARFVAGHFDLAGVVFNSPTWLMNMHVEGATLVLDRARFLNPDIHFENSEFTTGAVTFRDAEHRNGNVTFDNITIGDGMTIDWGPFAPHSVNPTKPT